METNKKFKLTVSRLDCIKNFSLYHPNPSCYSWVNLATDSKPPSNFIQVIIMVRPCIPGETCDEVTADYREGVAVINSLTYPMEEGEKEKAIVELGKIFSR